MIRSERLTASEKSTIQKIDWNNTTSGSVARYAQLTEDVGIKMYRLKAIRDICYRRQEIAWRADFAPRCWHPFHIKLWGMSWYGFYTEHAILPSIRTEDISGPDYSRLREKMLDTFPETNGEWLDLSNSNYGKIENKWVVIDFSHLKDSIGSVHKIKPRWCKHMERNRSRPAIA